MELGEKLRQARLEAGQSQRQLCGETITRNMLSQIEHGAARPSMETLKVLAARLGKPVSYFLDEDVVASPNQEIMESARRRYDAGDFAGTLDVLEGFQVPDEIFHREAALLTALARLGWAEELLETHRRPYAREILEKTITADLYCEKELEHRRLLLLCRLRETDLPSLDGELLIRAENALRAGNIRQAGHLLDAAEDRENVRWNFLRGQVSLAEKNFEAAARQFGTAEEIYPEQVIPCLEQCYRELGDYKRAYEYACKGRDDNTAR